MISVVIPFKNAQDFIIEALESVLCQTGVYFEIIMINDGSTDNSVKLVSSYKTGRSKLSILNSPNMGLVGALNFGISQAKGKYIARLDSDDTMLENRLKIQSNFLDSHPEVGVVGTQFTYMDALGNSLNKSSHYPVTKQELLIRIKDSCCIAHPTVMFRKSLVQGLGGYRSQFIHAEDYDLWLRVSEQVDLMNIDLPLTSYRMHPNQVSVIKRKEQELATKAAQISHLVRIGKINGIKDTPKTSDDLKSWVDNAERILKRNDFFYFFSMVRKNKSRIYWARAGNKKSIFPKTIYIFYSFISSPSTALKNIKNSVLTRLPRK
jgi:glycosyltransferase involved in cell wall biosynthesis